MTALTEAQIYDLRGDITDTGTTPLFSPEELQRFYDRADGDYDLAVYYALSVLIADPRLYFKEDAGVKRPMTEEEKNGTFARLNQLLDRKAEIAGVSGGVLRAGTIALDLDADTTNQNQWDGSLDL